MSDDTLRRLADEFASRIAHLDRVPDPIGLLTEFSAALARDSAETVFFKVQTEPGWTAETGQALADRYINDLILSTTDVIHAAGGTVEMALALGEAAANAYGTRLAELSAGFGQGGAA